MLFKINPVLEKRVRNSLTVLQPLLPKTRRENESPYSVIRQGAGNGKGPFHIIGMVYDEVFFERAPNIPDFITAFAGYYMLVTGEPLEPTGSIREGKVNMGLPESNPRIIAMLDTRKKEMHFGYLINDREAQLMMSSYIKGIMRNH